MKPYNANDLDLLEHDRRDPRGSGWGGSDALSVLISMAKAGRELALLRDAHPHSVAECEIIRRLIPESEMAPDSLHYRRLPDGSFTPDIRAAG